MLGLLRSIYVFVPSALGRTASKSLERQKNDLYLSSLTFAQRRWLRTPTAIWLILVAPVAGALRSPFAHPQFQGNRGILECKVFRRIHTLPVGVSKRTSSSPPTAACPELNLSYPQAACPKYSVKNTASCRGID